MKTLTRIHAFCAILVLFTSCGTVRLTETESIGKTPAKDGVSENEDLRINYDLWGEHGMMYFTIYNKSKKPVYIDWKKSVFIHNQWKNDYWVEKTTSEAITVPVGDQENKIFKNTMSAVVSERITFIPPDCYVSVPVTFDILDHLHRKLQLRGMRESKMIAISDNLRWDENAKKEPITNPETQKTFRSFALSYTKEQSPYRFRNFITYSADEKFTTEKYFDNEFYVKRFVQMSARRFFGRPFARVHRPKSAKILKNGMTSIPEPPPLYDSPFRASTSFYKTL